MRKSLFKETIKNLKKATKERLFIQFYDNKAYLSDGHYIVTMPEAYYTTFIMTAIPGTPGYTDNGKYVLEKGKAAQKADHCFNMQDMITDYMKQDLSLTTSCPMLFDIGDKLTRAMIWIKNGKAEGALINEDFYKMSKEYTNGTYYCIKSNAPIYTTNNDFGCFILPINSRDDSDFNEVLRTLNVEARKAA